MEMWDESNYAVQNGAHIKRVAYGQYRVGFLQIAQNTIRAYGIYQRRAYTRIHDEIRMRNVIKLYCTEGFTRQGGHAREEGTHPEVLFVLLIVTKGGRAVNAVYKLPNRRKAGFKPVSQDENREKPKSRLKTREKNI